MTSGPERCRVCGRPIPPERRRYTRAVTCSSECSALNEAAASAERMRRYRARQRRGGI